MASWADEVLPWGETLGALAEAVVQPGSGAPDLLVLHAVHARMGLGASDLRSLVYEAWELHLAEAAA